MRNADLIPFWTTVSQIVPVLAIALVLESRVLAQRYSKRRYYVSSRPVRATWGVTLFVLAGALTWTLAASLRFLASADMTQAVNVTKSMQTHIATSVLLAATFVLVSTPIAAIFNASVLDLIVLAARRMPWSKTSRSLRELARLDSVYRAMLADLRDEAHDILMALSRSLLIATAFERNERHVPPRPVDARREIEQLLDGAWETNTSGWKLYERVRTQIYETEFRLLEVADLMDEVSQIQRGAREEKNFESLRKHLGSLSVR